MMSPKISVVVSLLVAMSLVGSHLHARVVDPSAGKAALLVGVNTYQDAKMKPLRYSEADAAEIAEVLRASGYKVTLLLGKEATQAAVQRELTAIQKLGTKDGVLLLGFFGHGVQYDDLAHFCPYNATLRAVRDKDNNILRDDKTRLPLQEPDPQSLVSMRDMIDTLALSPAGSKLLLADCCREDPNAARGLLTGRGAFGSSLRVDQLPKNCAALFACSDGEQAFEHEDWKHGAFTKALLESLRSGKRITANGLSESVYDGVEKLVTSKGQRQTVNSFLTGGLIDLKLKLNPIMASDISKSKPQNTPAEPATPAGARSFVNSVGATMVLIPAGSFMMGSPDSDAGAYSNEKPQHRVTISRSFYMGETEVTQSQWKAVMETEPWKGQVREGSNYPATNVDWNTAKEFCRRLSQREGREYRLPTEAEWEYACRGGASTKYSFGDDEAELSLYAWFDDSPGVFVEENAYPHPVKQKLPNAYGLYDMHGNVLEWCFDKFRMYSPYPETDPTNEPLTNEPLGSIVQRGGHWENRAEWCRAAQRAASSDVLHASYFGFRPVLVVEKADRNPKK